MSTKSCPVSSCSFCWKNPFQVGVLLAVLPFAVAGAKQVVGWVSALFA